MLTRTRPFEDMSEELTGLADLLASSYGGHTVPDDFLHTRGGHRSTRYPTLLTRPMTRWDGGKAYSLSVYDPKFALLLTDLAPWAIANHKPDISEGQMNSFEARIQRGLVLTPSSGMRAEQFSSPLLTNPNLPASIGFISVAEAREHIVRIGA